MVPRFCHIAFLQSFEVVTIHSEPRIHIPSSRPSDVHHHAVFGMKVCTVPLDIGLLKASFIALDDLWRLWQPVELAPNSVTATEFKKGTGTACIEAPKSILLRADCRPNRSAPHTDSWGQYASGTCGIGGANRILSLAQPTKWRWPARPFSGVDCPTDRYTGFCDGNTAPDASYMSSGRNPWVFFSIESLARILSLVPTCGTGSKIALETAHTYGRRRNVGMARAETSELQQQHC